MDLGEGRVWRSENVVGGRASFGVVDGGQKCVFGGGKVERAPRHETRRQNRRRRICRCQGLGGAGIVD